MPASYDRRHLLFADFTAEVEVPYGKLNPLLMGSAEAAALQNEALGALPLRVLSSRLHNGDTAFPSQSVEQGVFIINHASHVYTKSITPGHEHADIDFSSSIKLSGAFEHTTPSGYGKENLPGTLSMNSDGSVLYEGAVLTIPDYPESYSQKKIDLLGHITLSHTISPRYIGIIE
jgi:hypothetical protein